MAKVDDRIKILTNLNGPYKNMTGKIIDVYKGGVVVYLDKDFHKKVNELGFAFRCVHIGNGNYQTISKKCMDVE